jgi:hypothetical protein
MNKTKVRASDTICRKVSVPERDQSHLCQALGSLEHNLQPKMKPGFVDE